MNCSLCLKPQHQVPWMMRGPAAGAICSECLERGLQTAIQIASGKVVEGQRDGH